MAETTREMVVRLSMDAGGFKKTASEINRQIRNLDKEIKGMGGETTPGAKSKLEEKLGLQQKAVENLQKAVEQARVKFNLADSDAQKLLAAKQLAGLESQLETATLQAERLKQQLSAANYIKWGGLVTNFGAAMVKMGRRFSVLVGAPLAALGGKAYQTAKDYETALVDLAVAAEKPVEEMGALDEQIKSLTERIPLGYIEITNLMATLARAGVAEKDLIDVVEIMAMLGATTDVSAEQSAAALIKFMNNTNLSADKMDELASVLFELGRASVSTGAEIFDMAEKMAATGGLAGFTAQDILALATAFSSMGIDAEAGGTSASKLMKRMQLAAETGKDIEDYTKVMGISAKQFTEAWASDPAKTMISFFDSLSKGGIDTSVLANLEEMGLTEIRLSRLIAAAASNPRFFTEMLTIADKAFNDTSGILKATEDVYNTQQSKQDIALNKIENTSADVGENIVDIVQPIIEKVSELVGEFAKLDEETQDRWVKIGGALVVLGPVASGIGSVATAVGKIAGWAGKVKAGEVDNVTKLMGALKGPGGGGWLLVAAGVAGVVAAINSIKTPTEQIIENLKNIEIGIDEESYAETTAALAEVKAQADALSGKTGEHNKNLSTAVKAGYGTTDMYGTALGYEARLTQSQMAEIAGKYAEDIDKLNGLIGAETDAARQKALADQRDRLQAQWDAEATAAKASYMAQVSALVAGMMQSQPEAKAALEQAAKDYDLLAALNEVQEKASVALPGEDISDLWAGIFTQDVRDRFFEGKRLDELAAGIAGEDLQEALMASMRDALAKAGGEDSFAYTLLETILGDPLTSGMYDQTLTTGALDGLVELLDYKNAAEQAGTNFGEALTPGLSDAITDSIPGVSGAMDAMQEQLVGQAAAMGAAVAAAFNNNLNFRLPNATGGGVNVNVNSPTAVDIYKIRKGLTDASRRAARGYGAG